MCFVVQQVFKAFLFFLSAVLHCLVTGFLLHSFYEIWIGITAVRASYLELYGRLWTIYSWCGVLLTMIKLKDLCYLQWWVLMTSIYIPAGLVLLWIQHDFQREGYCTTEKAINFFGLVSIMIPSFFNWLALLIYFVFTWLLFPSYLSCLTHCIKFYSWEKCEHYSVYSTLMMTGFHGASGFLWVSGNYRECHILYNWLIVTTQLIVLMCTYIIYANILADVHIMQWHLIYCGMLLIGFGLVILHLLESKKVIKNRLIQNLLRAITVPAGKV